MHKIARAPAGAGSLREPVLQKTKMKTKKKKVTIRSPTKTCRRPDFSIPPKNLTKEDLKTFKQWVRFFKYLEFHDQPGNYGCEQYAKYVDGNYCCVEDRPTDQELLDYVNLLLENALINMGPREFAKQSVAVDYLVDKRKYLLSRKDLVDNLDIDLDFEARKKEASEDLSDKSNMPPPRTRPEKHPDRLAKSLAIYLAEESNVK
jgi:hypothetical protein